MSSTLGCLILFSFAAAQDAPKAQLTARELFYTAVQTPAVQAAPQKKKKKPEVAENKTVAPPVQHSDGALPGGGRMIQASTAPAPASGTALGLKYTLLKLVGGEMSPVAPDTVFRAGDRIQFSVETNGPGYLYIISQGSSGMWKPMFPSTEVDGGSNHVEGFHSYTMPPKSRFYFDEQTGAEKLFIVFSREPQEDLEKVIYSLQGKAKPESRQVLRASIDDATVGRMRTAYARDLIIERVDESTPGEKKEKAVYVVNPTGSQDSSLVADLQLVHK